VLLAGTIVVVPDTLPFVGGTLFAGAWSIHQEALINSVCHLRKLGYRANDTPDDSTNIRWLSWLTWGQSLHNNHHADPRCKTFAHNAGDVDPGSALIAIIETA
jgi:stearoyl-CoA desaturase (delta-9 desaturase)